MLICLNKNSFILLELLIDQENALAKALLSFKHEYWLLTTMKPPGCLAPFTKDYICKYITNKHF